MPEQFNTETEFVQTILDRLGIDTHAWSEMSDVDRYRLLHALKCQRKYVVILNP